MVALLLEERPLSSSSSLPKQQSKLCPTASVSGVHYQLGRRGNCCSGSYYSDVSKSDNNNNSSNKGYHYCWPNFKISTMIHTTPLVTMALLAVLMSSLFLNVEASSATDILSSSLSNHNNNNDKFSFNSSSNSVFNNNNGGAPTKSSGYTHRFKGFDRILNRLDGRGKDLGAASTTTTGNNADSGSFANTKDHFHPSYYPPQPQPQQRRFSSSGGALTSGGGGKASSGSHHQPRSPTSSFPSLASLTGAGAGFKTPGKTYFDAGEDEDLDEEMDDDDDDSYEENDDDDTHDEELLNDKMSNWAHNYKNRYLAQRKSSPTTTTTTSTTTTTTTPPPPTTTTTTTTPAPISYSQWKWQNFGTRQGLEQFRRQMAGSGSGSSSSINSNSIYSPSSLPNGGGGSNIGGGGTGSSYPYNHHNNRQVGHHHYNNNNNNRYHGSSSTNYHNHHPSPYSPYSSGGGGGVSGRSSPSSSSPTSQGNSWTGGSNRAQPQTPGAAISEAVRHALKVRKEASCSVPQPRVVRVQDFYPHPGKTYVPHCTILHQCSDDTGCCRHDTLTCSPKTTQRVELAFYTITLDQSRAPMVDRLVFYNHTECECRDKLDEMMPRDQQYPSASSSVASTSTTSLLTMPSSSSSYMDPYSFSSTSSGKNGIIDSNSIDVDGGQCKCPSVFNERVLTDGACSCDCFDKEKKCLRLKRGRDFFILADKWCIQSGRCEVPECAYGPYIHLIGRCPRKRERSGQTTSWTRYLTNTNS